MEIIHEEPARSSFTPLAEHQSQTPQSFYSGPPVLYHYSKDARLTTLQSDLSASSALSKLAETSESNGTASNGHSETEDDKEIPIEGVDIWVTSEKFILYRPSTSTGLSIPYPSISLHAIQTLQTTPPQQGLYLQLATTDPLDDPDAGEASLALTLIPNTITPPEESTPSTTPSTTPATDASPQDASPTPISTLYSALSACANLHPDPASPGSSNADPDERFEDEGYQGADGEDEEPAYEYEVLGGQGGLPPPMPGSGGWITADNVEEFFDDEGNWRGRGLGPGAGVVRGREEEERQGGGEGVDGEGADDEAKWRRTD